MRKVLSFMVTALMLFSLASCSKYSSKYKAVGFVHSNTSTSAMMEFYTFDGRMVFRLNSAGEGAIKYSAKLESGSATVYCDYLGTESELFSINSGDEMDSLGGYVETGTVYIIVQTDGECRNGNFQFTLD